MQFYIVYDILRGAKKKRKIAQKGDCSHGAIDHVALDVRDIEEIFRYINESGLNSTQDTIHFLPFWENGVKFFTIEGPNKEKVEFSQYL